MRVLLIEDNDDDVLIIQEMFARAAGFAYKLKQADQLASGLVCLSEGQVDVVLVDLSLPDSTGFDTLTAVHHQAPHVPIIVLTSLHDETFGLQAVQAGAQDYLVKGQTDSNLLKRALHYAVERKRIEEALRHQRDWFDTTLVSIGEAVLTTQTDGCITFLNPAAERLTGWLAREAAGRPIDEVCQLIHQPTQQPLANLVTRVLQQRTVISLTNQTALQTRDGRQVSIIGSHAPIQNDRGDVHGVVLVLRDVSEQRRLEEELLRVRKIESLGVLAGGIAHDFNNLLTGIMGNLSLAKQFAGTDNRVVQRLSAAEHACEHAAALTHQLLTFAKGGTPVRQPTGIDNLLRQAVHFALSGSTVGVDFTIAPDLWPGNLDKGQMAHVFHNVVINAVHAMPKGGGIHVRAENATLTPDALCSVRPGRYVQIAIQDHGHGIPQNILANIFDPYFTTKESGSGLGLTTAYAIVAKHDGIITVETEVEVGTTVFIYLPASEHAVEPVQDLPALPLVGSGRILVMDDEAYIRDLLSEMIVGLGYTVDVAQDGAEAIALYQRATTMGQPFTVVILDVTIPGGMGGLEAMEHLRTVDPHVKAILSSGYAHQPVMANFDQYGFRAVLTKPYNLQQLNDVLQCALGRR